jgi:hypothetical protein
LLVSVVSFGAACVLPAPGLEAALGGKRTVLSADTFAMFDGMYMDMGQKIQLVEFLPGALLWWASMLCLLGGATRAPQLAALPKGPQITS